MTGLTSMLVPLRTLPGWPDVADPSLLSVLALFLGLPLAGLLVIHLLGQVGRLVARSRGETGPEIEHPLSIWGVETPEEYHALVRGELVRGELTQDELTQDELTRGDQPGRSAIER